MTEKNATVTAITKVEAAPQAMVVSGSLRINGVAEVFALAKHLARARGFVPKAFLGDEGSIAAAIMTGIELGMGPMESMRSIHIIEGRPTMSADLMLARAIRAGIRVTWLRTDTTIARIKLERAGFAPFELAYTVDDAKTAGLWGKNTWAKFPAQMLRARAISGAMRAYAPDVLGSGIYTSEEVTDGDVPDAPADAEVIEIVSRETGEFTTVTPSQLAQCKTLESTLEWLRMKRAQPEWQPNRQRIDAHIAKLATGAPEAERIAIAKMVDDALGVKRAPDSDMTRPDDVPPLDVPDDGPTDYQDA